MLCRALRGSLIAITSSTFLTSIDKIGIVWTNAIAAILSWIAYLYVTYYITLLKFH